MSDFKAKYAPGKAERGTCSCSRDRGLWTAPCAEDSVVAARSARKIKLIEFMYMVVNM
jgi:hypothetical protein